MKLCGHTMGTPKMDLRQAVEFMASLGCAAIEVRCAANGQLDPARFDAAQAAEALATARRAGIAFGCLTPYFKNFVDPAVRERELAGLRAMLQIAARLECPLVRVYGGVPPAPGGDAQAAWDGTARALRELAAEAAPLGVTLVIETHGGTLTPDAVTAARMAAQVDHPNLGILFDYVWIHLAGTDTIGSAVARCAKWIRHVHVKDCVVQEPEHRAVARLLGEGTIDLPALIAALRGIGYQGLLCDEYEKFWQPDLPDPETGMTHNAAYLRHALA
ncbi:MAG: sugar phosphate isomerase/epimerase family protein [Planctomycetota bacterium]